MAESFTIKHTLRGFLHMRASFKSFKRYRIKRYKIGALEKCTQMQFNVSLRFKKIEMKDVKS